MSRERSPVGQALSGMALVGAILLVVSLFLDWFTIGDAEEEISVNGWAGLEFGDFLFVLILLGTAGVVFAGRNATDETRGASRGRHASRLLGLGALALVFVGLAAITTVPTVEILGSFAGSEVETSREAGLFLAGGGALLLLISGVMGVATEAEGRRATESAPRPGPGAA